MALTRKERRTRIYRANANARHEKRRKELGLPEPTEHERKLRRLRNQRYAQKQLEKKLAACQKKAA